MAGLVYYKLPKHPGQLSAEELRALIPDEAEDSQVMRSLLLAELERCQQETVEQRTMRGLWYTYIKPSLAKLGRLSPSFEAGRNKRGRKRQKAPTEADLAAAWADKLSIYLAELVRLGQCSYSDMQIVDGSRQRRPAREASLYLEAVPVVGVHYPNIILFTEKDTIFPLLDSLASIYGISAISGGGGPSFACTENLLDKIEQHGNGERLSLILLGLTDYDPSGYTIFNAQVEQLQDMSRSRPMFTGVQAQRLGLEPGQLTEEEIENNAYPPAKKGLKKWTRQTGGINGQPLGLELDALPLSQIRALFVAGINKYVQTEEPYHQDLRAAAGRLLIDEALQSYIGSLRHELGQQLNGQLESLQCSGEAVRRAALAGQSYIHPLEAFEDAKLDKLREKLGTAVREIVPEG